MSKLICIDCDRNELRVVVGSSGLTGVSVDHCFSRFVEIPTSDDFFESPLLADGIKKLLSSNGIRTGNAVVTVPRSLVELRTVQVPTTDKNELPDMVRFAAQRHFANAGDNWPVDFLVLGSPSEGVSEVMAASINPTHIDRIQSILDSCGVKLQQLVLRPMVASAVALLKRPELKEKPAIFVDRFGDELDMSVVDGKHVVFMRSIRLAKDLEPEQYTKTLSNEIKRTLLSSVSQNAGLQVSEIFLWGTPSEWGDIPRSLSDSLKVPATTIDPLSLVDSKPGSHPTDDGATGKFAAAIGGLLAPTYYQSLIDFAHPRKREEKKTPVLKYVLGATVASLLLGIPTYSHLSHSWDLDSQINQLNASITENKPTAEIADAKVKEWGKIHQFLNSSVNWLEELKIVSEKALPSEEVVFSGMSFSANNSNVGTMASKYAMVKREDAALLQDALRSAGFRVEGKGVTGNNTIPPGYPWTSDLIIQTQPYVAEDPLQWGKKPLKLVKPVVPPPEVEKVAEPESTEKAIEEKEVETSNSEAPATSEAPAASEPTAAPANNTESSEEAK